MPNQMSLIKIQIELGFSDTKPHAIITIPVHEEKCNQMSSPLDQEHRTRPQEHNRSQTRFGQDIASVQDSWDLLSKQISGVETDLGLEMDGQRKVILRERLDKLKQERAEVEIKLESLGAPLRCAKKPF